jgi:hypothetical protein
MASLLVKPPTSGVPVPGAKAGSTTSISIDKWFDFLDIRQSIFAEDTFISQTSLPYFVISINLIFM